MPDDKEPIPKFAARIKAKYPQYKDMNDTLLTQKIIEKYPQYADMVEMPSIVTPKVEPAQPPQEDIWDKLNKEAAANQPTIEQQEKAVGKKPTINAQELQDDPFKAIMNPVRQDVIKQSKDFLTEINRPVSESTSKQKLSVKNAAEKSNVDYGVHELSTNPAGIIGNTEMMVADQLFPNGKKAKEYVDKQVAQKGAQPDNETFQVAKAKADRYNSIKTALKNESIENLALEMYRRNNPNFDARISKINQEGHTSPGSNDLIPPETKGVIVARWLQSNKDDLDEIMKEKADVSKDGLSTKETIDDATAIKRYGKSFVDNIKKKYGANTYMEAVDSWYKDQAAHDAEGVKNEYNDLKQNIRKVYPEYGSVLIANEISRERQKRGLNNPVVNFDTKTFRNNADKIASELYKDDPVSKQVYNENRDKILEKIDVPGIINKFYGGIEKGMTGTRNTINAMTDTPGMNIYEKLQHDYSGVSAGETGIQKTLGQFADLAGFVTFLAAEGKIGIPSRIGIGTSILGDALKENDAKYPTDRRKAIAASVGTAVSYIVFPDAIPVNKINNAMSAVKKEISKSLSELGEKEVSAAAIKDATMSGLKKGLEYAGQFAKQHVKTVADLTAITMANQGIDKALGLDEKTFKEIHPSSEVADQLKLNAIINIPLSAIGGYGEYAKRNFAKESVYDISSNPKKSLSQVDMMTELSPGTRQQLIDNINLLSETKTLLDQNGVPEAKQKTYLLHTANEKNLEYTLEGINQRIEATKEPVLKSKIEEQKKEIEKHIEESRKIKDKILSGKEVKGENNLPQDEHEFTKEDELHSEPEEKTAQQSAIELLHKDVEDGKLTGVYAELSKDNPIGVLKDLSQQAQGFDENWKPLAGGGREAEMKKEYSPELIKAAKEAFPKPSVSVIRPEENKVAESIPLIKKEGGQNAIPERSAETLSVDETPRSSEEVGGRIPESKEPTNAQEESKGKGEEEVADELPFSVGGGGSLGIKHESQERRAGILGEEQPVRGVGVTVGEAIEHGKDLIADGKDPQKAADDFKKDSKISFDSLSLVRAKYEELGRKTNKAADDYGTNSKEYKAAVEEERKWYNEVVKPMQTEWHKVGQAQQGETDIDTGTFTGLTRAVREKTGKPLTAEQEAKAKELSTKVQTLEKEVEDLKLKLTEVVDKNTKEKSKTTKERAKDLAAKIRDNAKLHKPGSFSAASPASLVWDTAVEIVAKTIEAGGTIAQAIQNGVREIRNSDWYKSLNTNEKKKAEDDFIDFHVSQEPTDILTRFQYKKGDKFTPDEIKAIWDYAKENYIDKGASFDDMIHGVSMELGLSPQQIRKALSTPKGAKQLTDRMYQKQYQRNQAVNTAKAWVQGANTSGTVKVLKTIPAFFFGLKVFGHGTVGMVTHAGMNIFRPTGWKQYWPNFFKQFRYAYGNTAKYEQAMQDLKRDPDFVFWKRNGLAVDPTEKYDDYQFISKYFGKLGKAGDRGFNALKVYRLAQAKAIWKTLSNVEKADPETAKEIAKIVNHSTSTSKVPLPDVANYAFFAPRLEWARWNKLIVQPAKALHTFTNWNNATPAQKAAAKIVAKRAGEMLAVYVGALAANNGLLIATGSNQRVNFLYPQDSDWLKFKGGGHTFDPTGGMRSTVSFIGNLFTSATTSEENLHGKGRFDVIKSRVGDYAAGKLSPFASTAKDIATQHDFRGNVMPWSNDTPKAGKHKLSWAEYLGTQQTPIPVAEALNDVSQSMKERGMSDIQISDVLRGIFVGAVSGGTGIHVKEDTSQEKKEAQNKKSGKQSKPKKAEKK